MAMPLKSHLNPTTPWGLMSVTLTATKASGGFFRLRASACGARAATAATATRARRERDERGSMVVLLAVAGDRCQRAPPSYRVAALAGQSVAERGLISACRRVLAG